MLVDTFAMVVLCVLFGASLATSYWLYRLWQTAAWKTKQLERVLWAKTPISEFVTDADIGWTDED